VDLRLSDEQRHLARGAREFLADACPPTAVAEGSGPDSMLDRDLWKQCAAVGFLAITVPEAQGGLGLGLLDLVGVLEEAGRALLPLPLLETAVVAAALARWGADATHLEWLSRIAAGDLVAVVVLPGQRLVADADSADLFLIVDEAGAVSVVPRDGVRVRRCTTSYGGRRLSTLTGDPQPASVLGPTPAVGRYVANATAVANAALLVGICDHLLAATVEHVKVRHQFGRPVGSFQAVKHRLADAHLALETARPSVWVAAHQIDLEDDDAEAAAAIAAIAAADAHRVINEQALQCHGGMGFAQHNPLHLWLTHGKDVERAYGSVRQHRARLGRALLHPNRPDEELAR
jgi:alkylation response protein AidB-like acyl-CoA dehydrogenase